MRIRKQKRLKVNALGIRDHHLYTGHAKRLYIPIEDVIIIIIIIII